jgi:predicted transposase/invertase (TIGR01784 family)
MAKRTNKLKKTTGGKDEGNSYDKIFKENLRELAPGIIRSVLGYKVFRLEPLPQVKLQTTLEKEPDFFVKIFDQRSPDGRILHIEFEGQDEKLMDWRMAEYLGIGGKVHQTEIEQHLVYLGEGMPSNFKGEIRHTNFTYVYPVHCLSEISFAEFLYADTPQEVVFAILADPGGRNSEDLIRMILERLVKLTGDSIGIRKFIKQLIMLSKKRNLRDQTIKNVKNMVGYQDYEDDILFIEGLEQGREQGQEEKDITTIRNMTGKHFDPATIAEVLEVPVEYVYQIQEQLKKEPSIAAMLKMKDADFIKIAKQLEVNPLLVKVIQQHLKK